MKKLCVDKKFENKKLSVFLLHNINGLSINTVYKLLRKKDILVNDVRVTTNISLHEKDTVIIYIKDELLNKKIEPVYEDANILVINKPTQIEVVNNNSNEKSVTDMLREESGSNEFPVPCHRLDRNTSGLLLFAKNSFALEILLKKFKEQEIEKHYLCTVYGIPKQETACLSAYLFKDTKKSLVHISDVAKNGYQKIITSYTVLSKNIEDNTCELDVELHTGRTHQIRAHLAHIELPVIGDRKIWKE